MLSSNCSKRLLLAVAVFSLAGCSGSSRSFTWRRTETRPRVRAYCTPPVAPEFMPAGIEKPSTLPPSPAAPTPIPHQAPPEPTIAPEAPLETTAAPRPWEEDFALPLPPEHPSSDWDLTPLDEPSLEYTPRTRRTQDRPTSTRKEEKSAVEELGDGPIARHRRSSEPSLKVARTIPRGHTSAPDAADQFATTIQTSFHQ